MDAEIVGGGLDEPSFSDQGAVDLDLAKANEGTPIYAPRSTEALKQELTI